MDLKQFFQLEHRHQDFIHDATFYSALQGLCSALSHTHSLRLNHKDHGVNFDAIGYHHDIRPANILVNRNTFILADFGLGKVKDAEEHSQTHWTSTTGDYWAPECTDDERNPQEVTRAIDVWAFACLIADMVAYIYHGPKGVASFSSQRRSPGRCQWVDRVFYGSNNRVKNEVIRFLEDLPECGPQNIPVSPLVQLSLDAFIREPSERPKTGRIRDRLTFLSLQAHFRSICERFKQHAVDHKTDGSPVNSNELWLSQQRFHAWGWALWLCNPTMALDETQTAIDIYKSSTETMLALRSELDQVLGRENRSLTGGTTSTPQFGGDNENSIFEGVESLWLLLPPRLRMRADDHWNRSALSSENIDHLQAVRRILASRHPGFDSTRALAMMKMLRAAILNPELQVDSDDLQTWVLNSHDVKRTPVKNGSYSISSFKGSDVLVEWMWSTPAWAKVHQDQRSLVMCLRARYFGMDRKPPSLKTLDCLGIFEETGRRSGYGFVYQIPSGVQTTPMSLLHSLDQDRDKRSRKRQPALGVKFKLAFAVADFLEHFHMVGWLHESLNSGNILFFPPSDQEEGDTLPENIWESPYFVGLHRSRPDGSLWQTAGPDSTSDFQDPQYVSTGRYRIEYDYYSLGVILLEIGLWRSIGSLLNDRKYTGLGGQAIQQKLIDWSQTQLGPRMGTVYKDLVVQCLDGSISRVARKSAREGTDDSSDAADRSALLEKFSVAVVEPLRSLSVASV